MDSTPTTDTAAPTAEAGVSASKLASLFRARVDDLQVRAKELADRAKGLQAKAKDLPTAARTRALALVARIRIALDLPSRSEIAELTARLDKLDQRIAQIAAGAPAAAPIATLPEAAPEPVTAEGTAPEVPEQSRKDKKRHEAAKKARR